MNLLIVLGAMFGIAGSLFLPIRKMRYMANLRKNRKKIEYGNTPNREWSNLYFELLAFGQIAVGFLYEILSQFGSNLFLPSWLVIVAIAILSTIWYYGFSTEVFNSDNRARIMMAEVDYRETEARTPWISVSAVLWFIVVIILSLFVGSALFINFGIQLNQSVRNYLTTIIDLGILPMAVALVIGLSSPYIMDEFILSMYPEYESINELKRSF